MALIRAPPVACVFLALVQVGDGRATALSEGRYDLALSGRSRAMSFQKRLSREMDEGLKKNPIKKVIHVLQEMSSALEKEADEDEKQYDKMVCWCETQEKQKVAAIAKTDADIDNELSDVDVRSARKGSLKGKISGVTAAIKRDDAALDEGTSIHKKEDEAFNKEAEEQAKVIASLRNALAILKKHMGSSFLQLSPTVVASVKAVLQDAMMKFDLAEAKNYRRGGPGASNALRSVALLALDSHQGRSKVLQNLFGSHTSREVLPVDIAQHMLAREAENVRRGGSFVQEGETSSGSMRTPASASIIGILGEMLNGFQANLKQTQSDEKKGDDDYKDLESSKAQQISVGKAKLDKLQDEQAANGMGLENAKEDLGTARTEYRTDDTLLRELRKNCADLDLQYSQRKKARLAEAKAVSETIVILTEDSNREAMDRGLTFLQERSTSNSEAQMRRSRAFALLRSAVRRPESDSEDFDDLAAMWHSRGMEQVERSSSRPKRMLANLAISIKMDSFTEVKQMMDKMVADLKDEQSEDIKLRTSCMGSFRANEKELTSKNLRVKDLSAKKSGISKDVEALEEEKAAAEASISSTKESIAKASEIREQERAEFQATEVDQIAVQRILKKALKRFAAQYGKEETMLIQVSAQDEEDPGEVKAFNKYKSNAGANPVIELLNSIIADSKHLLEEAKVDEAKAQADHEAFVEDSNAAIAELTKKVREKTNKISKAQVDKENTQNDKKKHMDRIMSLMEYKADLHKQCDWMLKNFEKRQEARTREIESIKNAKAILSGAKQ